MSDSDAGKVTALLRAWHAGDEDAYRQVSSILYSELRRQAAQHMRRKRSGDTLQTTALVHETFMRLAARQVDWQDRRHFLAVAARTMRQLLVDLARAKGSAKRGAQAAHLPLDSGITVGGPELTQEGKDVWIRPSQDQGSDSKSESESSQTCPAGGRSRSAVLSSDEYSGRGTTRGCTCRPPRP
jgi:DNA-directed RNA polymerase specialized sigma24 family protein